MWGKFTSRYLSKKGEVILKRRDGLVMLCYSLYIRFSWNEKGSLEGRIMINKPLSLERELEGEKNTGLCCGKMRNDQPEKWCYAKYLAVHEARMWNQMRNVMEKKYRGERKKKPSVDPLQPILDMNDASSRQTRQTNVHQVGSLVPIPDLR